MIRPATAAGVPGYGGRPRHGSTTWHVLNRTPREHVPLDLWPDVCGWDYVACADEIGQLAALMMEEK